MRLEDNISKGPFKTIQGNLFVTGDISDVYSKEQFDSQFTVLEDRLQAQVDAAVETATTYRKGEIIEVIARQCDGGTVEGVSGTYTFENVTDVAELNNATHTKIPGSLLTYTPPTGAKTVIYEYSFQWRNKDSNSISHFKLNVDGSDIVYSRFNMNINSASVYNTQVHYRWVIDINASANDSNTGAMTSWTTPKDIQLLGRDYGGSNEGFLFGTYYWDGGGTDVFNQPRLSITAIA